MTDSITDTPPDFLEYLNAPPPDTEDNEILQPPQKRTRRRRKDTTPTDTLGEGPVGPRVSRRESRLIDLYSSIGMALMLFDPFDGQVVMAGARDRAHELAMVCKEYPDVGKWVDRLLSGSVWTAFIMGHGAMAFAIAAHHGVLPAGIMGRFGMAPETAA